MGARTPGGPTAAGPDRARRARRALLGAMRVLLAGGLIAWLVHRAGLADLAATLRASAGRPGWIAAGLALLFPSLCAGWLRWRVLLAAEGLPLPARRSFRFFFIGQFFNAFLLGACGGDMARAYLAARAVPARRAEAVTTVLVDRATGLLVMVLFCATMVAARWSAFDIAPGARGPRLLLLVLLGTALVLVPLFFSHNVFARWPGLARAAGRYRLLGQVQRVYEAAFRYRERRRLLPALVGYSLLSLGLLTLSCACFGRALALPVGWVDYFTFFPIVNLLAAVPLTPGGLGVREQLSVTLFGAAGASPEQALLLSLMIYGAGLVYSLLGGALLLAQAAGAGRSLREEVQALRAEADGEGADREPLTVNRK